MRQRQRTGGGCVIFRLCSVVRRIGIIVLRIVGIVLHSRLRTGIGICQIALIRLIRILRRVVAVHGR